MANSPYNVEYHEAIAKAWAKVQAGMKEDQDRLMVRIKAAAARERWVWRA